MQRPGRPPPRRPGGVPSRTPRPHRGGRPARRPPARPGPGGCRPPRGRGTRASLPGRRRASRRAAAGTTAPRPGGGSPGTVMTGAGVSPPSRWAVRSASTVADIATTTRSSRRFSRTSTSRASVRSTSSCRSCTSSRTTASTPGSSGSRWIRRSRTPVVTTSIRVVGPERRSPRTAYPTVWPTGSPSRPASRLAAARAAIRRGCVTTTRPVTRAATAGGTREVLPVPGGAWTTAVPRARSAAARAASPATTGRSGGRARSRWIGSPGTPAVCPPRPATRTRGSPAACHHAAGPRTGPAGPAPLSRSPPP